MRLQLHKRHLKGYFTPPPPHHDFLTLMLFQTRMLIFFCVKLKGKTVKKVVLFNIFVEFVIYFFKIVYRIELNAPLLNKIINLFKENLPGTSVH